MTLKQRLQRANGMTRPLASTPRMPYAEFTILYVDDEGTHRDKDGNIVEKNGAGMWCLHEKPIDVPLMVVCVSETMRTV